MNDWIEERKTRFRQFFELSETVELEPDKAVNFEVPPAAQAALERFNIEWHFVPPARAVALDENYLRKMYPSAPSGWNKNREHRISLRKQLVSGHSRQQGCIIGVETTQKPRYLPQNQQSYGTLYGHLDADPLRAYIGQAGMTGGTRFAHNYRVLRRFFEIINEDWQRRKLLPEGFRVTVCPPGIFNLIGNVFHPEWSEAETLELGFYRDERGNATCFAVGANAPGDFSYLDVVESENEWALMGFRIALLPDCTRHDAREGKQPK